MRALLDHGLGKDLSAELSVPAHRAAMEQLLQHHKLGKYMAAHGAHDEKVSDPSVSQLESPLSFPIHSSGRVSGCHSLDPLQLAVCAVAAAWPGGESHVQWTESATGGAAVPPAGQVNVA